MKSPSLAYALALTGLAAACTSENPDVSDDGALQPPPDGTGYQMQMELTVEPGQELFKCQYYRPTDAAFDVQGWQIWYTAGSHHLLIYTTNYTEIPREGLFDCPGQDGLGIRSLVFGAQNQETVLDYPTGVGLHFDPDDIAEYPGTVILIQTHYLNATTEPIDADVRINLLYAAPGSVEQYAGLLFFFNWNIFIPSGVGSEGSTTMSCTIDDDIQLLTVGSHMHRRGVNFQSTLNGEDLYQTDDWEEAGVLLEPEKPISAGSTFEFTCDYVNDREDATIIGPSADVNEMCVLIGVYYPKIATADENCGNGGPVLTGNQTCAETVDCIGPCLTNECVGTCISETCEGSGDAYYAFQTCGFDAGCFSGSGDVAACIADECVSEYLTCISSGC